MRFIIKPVLIINSILFSMLFFPMISEARDISLLADLPDCVWVTVYKADGDAVKKANGGYFLQDKSTGPKSYYCHTSKSQDTISTNLLGGPGHKNDNVTHLNFYGEDYDPHFNFYENSAPSSDCGHIGTVYAKRPLITPTSGDRYYCPTFRNPTAVCDPTQRTDSFFSSLYRYQLHDLGAQGASDKIRGNVARFKTDSSSYALEFEQDDSYSSKLYKSCIYISQVQDAIDPAKDIAPGFNVILTADKSAREKSQVQTIYDSTGAITTDMKANGSDQNGPQRWYRIAESDPTDEPNQPLPNLSLTVSLKDSASDWFKQLAQQNGSCDLMVTSRADSTSVCTDTVQASQLPTDGSSPTYTFANCNQYLVRLGTQDRQAGLDAVLKCQDDLQPNMDPVHATIYFYNLNRLKPTS